MIGECLPPPLVIWVLRQETFKQKVDIFSPTSKKNAKSSEKSKKCALYHVMKSFKLLYNKAGK